MAVAMAPASRPGLHVRGRRAIGGFALTLAVTAALAGCGGNDDGATATGGTSSAPAAGAAPAATADTAPAASTAAPATGGSATTAPTATSAAGAAVDTVPEAQVAEMERTLDEIDQVLSDLDADFKQDQE
ncbi:MAG: hypothetical protein R2761_18000 [Acidimicrobiales bacterium]